MKIIELLNDLNYFEAGPINIVRPFPPAPPMGTPPIEIQTYDNSVRYPRGTRLQVEVDEER
jgi:hypothetical protein